MSSTMKKVFILGFLVLSGCGERGLAKFADGGTVRCTGSYSACGVNLRKCENGREYYCVKDVEWIAQ